MTLPRSACGCLLTLALALTGCFDFGSLKPRDGDAGAKDATDDAPRDSGPKDATADGDPMNRPDACSDEWVTDAGAPIKRVFLTSVRYDGNLGGLAGADAKCQALAEAAGHCGTWKAFLSDSTERAQTRALHPTAAYELLDGKRVVDSLEELEAASYPLGPALQANIDIDENGDRVLGDSKTGEVRVWTGTVRTESSLPVYRCMDWTSDSGEDTGTKGYARNASSVGGPNYNWLSQNPGPCSFAFRARLYCFEQ